MEIPKQLQHPDFRFVLLGKWDDVIKKEGSKDLFKGKSPFEMKWQTENNYDFNHPKLLNHPNNFGVIGGYGKLRILDIDDKELGEEFEKKLDTFTVKTGSGGKHFYFISDYETNHVLVNELGELRAKNYQVVSAPSKHPSGNLYEVVKDIPIKKVSYGELFNIIKPYLREENQTTATTKQTGIDTTRSALEYRKIISLLRQGKERKEIYEIMDAYSKWATAHDKYKSLTFEKAENFVLEEEEGQPTGDLKSQYLFLVRDKKLNEASELIVDWIKENNHIYTTKVDDKNEMWIYKDGIYIPQGKSQVKTIMRDLLEEWYSAFSYNQVMNKLEADTFIEVDDFFIQNHIYEVPVQNGILDLKMKTLSEYTPEKIFFNKLHVNFNPIATCPRIDQFLSEILTTEDDKQVYYELGGFSLLKEYKFEKAFMLVGDGRNGKDKCLELLKRLIGVENCCSVPLCALVPDSFIISMFFGKMLNVAGDINNKDLKDTSTFKALTGRSLMSAPRKFLNPITFQNYAKFVFACNELPMVYDNSKGFWDRWVLLEFPYTFVTQQELDTTEDKKGLKLRNENIIEEITTPQEMEGLLNRCLEGLHRLFQTRNFSTTKGSKEIKDLWIRKSNGFMAFCLDDIESDYDKYITKKDLRKRYHEYCKTHNIQAKTDYVIKRTLEELFGSIEGRRSILNYQERVWEGIKFKDKSKLPI